MIQQIEAEAWPGRCDEDTGGYRSTSRDRGGRIRKASGMAGYVAGPSPCSEAADGTGDLANSTDVSSLPITIDYRRESCEKMGYVPIFLDDRLVKVEIAISLWQRTIR